MDDLSLERSNEFIDDDDDDDDDVLDDGKQKDESKPTKPKVWTSPLPKPNLDTSLYGEKNVHELAEYIDWHKRNPRSGTPQLKKDRKHLKMPPISEWTHDNEDLYFPKQLNFHGNDSLDAMGRPVVPPIPDEIHQPKFGDGDFDNVSVSAFNLEFDIMHRSEDNENDFFNRNNIERGPLNGGGKDGVSIGGSVRSWGTKLSVSEQLSMSHEQLSPRSLNMKEFDPNENMFDWQVVAKKQAAYRAKREKEAAELKRQKDQKEFDWLQERNMHVHKNIANQEREGRQKAKPVWKSGYVWTQFTANGSILDEWNVDKMESLVRKALTAYFDEREASGEVGVVRRGEGHWKDEMKTLPPALSDIVDNVKSFFSPVTLLLKSKTEKVAPIKDGPTAEEKKEELQAHLKANADAEAEQVLNGTCRHGRKREDCRECREHSPEKKPEKGLLTKEYNPDVKYFGMVEKLGGGDAVGKMADEWTKYAEKVRKKAQRQGELSSVANNPSVDIADACLMGSAIRVVSSLATGDAEPNEEHEGSPVVHIAIKQALLLDDISGAIYLNSPNIGDRAKFQKIIDVFHMYNCDFEIQGVEGTCGLHMAAAHGNLKMIEYFLRKKVNINVRAGIGAHELYNGTPIMFAAKFGHVEALAHLVRRGGNMELQADNGNTALHFAAETGESRVCTFLMHIGASKRIKNKESLLAGQLASINRHRVCAQTILEYAVLPEGPERMLTYLNMKLDQARDKHRSDETKRKAKNIMFQAANKFFEGATKFVDDLLACIPYFRRKQEEEKRNKAIKEAANRIFKPSNAASHAADDDSDDDDVVK